MNMGIPKQNQGKSQESSLRSVRHEQWHRGTVGGIVGEEGTLPPVLDVCCGGRMMWFDKKNPNALYLDKREEHYVSPDGYEVTVEPDIVSDFIEIPFPDESFYLVVFDPPQNGTQTAWRQTKEAQPFRAAPLDA